MSASSFRGMNLEPVQSRKHSVMTRHSQSSGSEPSLPISIPYFYIANNDNSFDTVNMLNSFTTNQPQYSNTSHLNMSSTPTRQLHQVPPAVPEKDKVEPLPGADYARTGLSGTGGLLNQVPKRFSQFILDQQNPYMVQRLDHLSMNLISMYSGGTPSYVDPSTHRLHRRSHPHTGSTATSSQPKKPSTDSAVETLARNILDSMGSQATIFSIRPQDADSHASSLRRLRAVRAKDGVLYRLKLRLKKMAHKVRYIFTVPRKKTVKPVGPTKQKRRLRLWRRRPPTAKGAPIKISAPMHNPKLGDGIELVPMDSRLKAKAGVQNANPVEVNDEDSLKRKMLLPPAPVPVQRPLLQQPAPPSPSPRPVPTRDIHSNRKLLQAPVMDDSLEDVLIEAWRHYLTQVVASRIKLRQEINFFQSLKKEQEYKFGIDTEEELVARSNTVTTAATTEPTAAAVESASMTRESTVSYAKPSYKMSVKLVATATSEYESDDDVALSVLDPATDEFNHAYANRHSVLGDMLDYVSDTTSVSSQTSVATSTGPEAISREDLGLGARYGTVVRHTKQRTPLEALMRSETLKRSTGFHMGLSEALSA